MAETIHIRSIKNEYDRVRELLGRRPTRIDLFTYMEEEVYQLAVEHSKENPFKHYLEFLKELGEISDGEMLVYNSIGREFISVLENTSMNKTIDYYEKNAEIFADSTSNLEFSEMQDLFLEKLNPGTAILDFGCGSGRDTKYFLEKGYQVTALDGSAELCRIAGEKTGIPVIQMDFNDFDEQDRYDGIWACASILHLPEQELKNVLIHMEKALHDGGIIYTSFKYGDFSGMRNGRFFTDFTEDSFRMFITGVEQLTMEKLWITDDVRPGRQDEKWLNLILRTTRR